jgi:hypothetical protein
MSPRTILSWGLLALLAAAAPSMGQKPSGMAVKQDGDTVVLIPQEPGKTFLVLGYPRKGGGKGTEAGVTYVTGERRLPARQFARLQIFELTPVSEVKLDSGAAGLRLDTRPCQTGTCDKPIPLACPPSCPLLFLLTRQEPPVKPPVKPGIKE